jgi:hypothetical protein
MATLAFIGGLMAARTARNALVVVPATLTETWRREAICVLPECVKNVSIHVIDSKVSGSDRRDSARDAVEWYVV